MITLGIDLGTSGIKLVLLDDDDRVVAHSSQALPRLSHPQPGFSEQDPQDWWQATCRGLDDLKAREGAALAATEAIGLSGQMHGATLLDARDQVLRPCILWNDGRSEAQCAELERTWPALREVTGNIAMPGFTAPKLLWVREHEPEVFAKVAKVLLPKAWLRWRLSGEYAEDMSDASGTLWLDVGARRWSEAALAACGMTLAQMPRLVEGSEPAGRLSPELSARWGFAKSPLIAGGAGDNAAGAVGVGAVKPGDAFVSLGTSGVLWATTARFQPNPARAVHAFCHAVPNTWHQMGVLLSAAASLAWWASVAGRSEAELLAELGNDPARDGSVWFAPYLSGERTPHNDARVRGGFAGLSSDTTRAQMTLAVLDGVAYALRDAQLALADAGTVLADAALIGGGGRSPLWSQTVADVLGIPLHQLAESDIGCALGAARLARMALGESIKGARAPARVRSFEPDAARSARHARRHADWQRLYPLARDFSRSLHGTQA